jgi:hypothetical protein
MEERDEERAAEERYQRLLAAAESDPLWRMGIEDVDPEGYPPEGYVQLIYVEEDPDPTPPSERPLPHLDGDVDYAPFDTGDEPRSFRRQRRISRLVPRDEYEKVHGRDPSAGLLIAAFRLVQAETSE